MTFFVLVLCISVFIYLYFPAKLKKQALEAISSRSRTMSEFLSISLSPALFFEDQQIGKETADQVGLNKDISWMVVKKKDGKLFASTGLDRAKKMSYESVVSKDAVLGDGEYFMTITPILQDGVELGKLFVGYSLESMNASISESRWVITLISFAVLIVGTIFAWGVSIYFTRNLGSVVETMDKVGAGDLTQRAPVKSRDEVGFLAETFNQMVDRLDESTQEIKNREVQFRTLVENMNEGLVELDENGTIIFANTKFCNMFGYLEIEVIQKSILQIAGVKPEDAKLFFGVASGETSDHQFEVELINNQGLGLWTLVSMSYGGLNSPSHQWTAIFTDITSLKRTENTLRFKNRELDTFVYKASHDLKAPLSSMQGLLNIAKEESKDPLSLRYFDLIERTTEKMDGVLMGLLEITWIKQGSIDLTIVKLDSLLDEILSSIVHTTGFNTVQVRNQVLSGTTLISDVKMLTSILQNLIYNAFKYHRETGSNKYIEISTRKVVRGIEIIVKDNGPGIEDSAQERLFDMFFRATTKSKGSGLGLYIVKNAAEKLKGTVTLKSKVGEGSEFTVFLPQLELPV